MIFTGSDALNLEYNNDSARRSLKKEIYPLNFAEYLYLKYDIIPKKIRRIRMTLEFVDNYLNAKLAQNREIIKFSFYEVRMKLNLSEEDSITFLSLISQKLMNTGYLVYKTGEEYTYKGKTFKIQENELLVAILKESAK